MTSRIMVVDDDAGLRETLEEILLDNGRDVVSAEDGYKAIELASKDKIDLILMDVQMPGINGVDAFLEIKEILPDCVVVIMTGHAAESLLEEALSKGVRTILKKPVPIERILGIVEEIMPQSVA